jgi:hypothetical protein
LVNKQATNLNLERENLAKRKGAPKERKVPTPQNTKTGDTILIPNPTTRAGRAIRRPAKYST